MLGERVAVLLAAGGASWEVAAMRVLAGDPGRVTLLKRCVDLADLLASASTGQARVAVVAGDLPGLDVDSATRLRESGTAVVVLVRDGQSVPDLPGVCEVLPVEEVDRLPAAVVESAIAGPRGVEADTDPTLPARDGADERDAGDAAVVDAVGVHATGAVVAVWGPAGAPGRTTVAVGLAATAARSTPTLLVDADPYGGAVAQHLGVLDEVSGLLGAARLANAGKLDPASLAAAARTVAPGLRVLTGLPRADRWAEVRETAFGTVVEEARMLSRLVVTDLGFCLEHSGPSYGASSPQRNQMTVAGLDRADEVLVVGSADPVGLSRLARGLVDLLDVVPAARVRVLVNRVRPSLGWGEREVRAMVEGFVAPTGVHFLPYDLGAADQALMEGRPVSDVAGSPLARALVEVTAAVTGATDRPRVSRRLRLRTAGRAR